jgi:hypothetical protein
LEWKIVIIILMGICCFYIFYLRRTLAYCEACAGSIEIVGATLEEACLKNGEFFSADPVL